MSQLELFNDRPKFYPKHDEHLEGWHEYLGDDTLRILAEIMDKVTNLYHSEQVYPDFYDIFKAFDITKPLDIRVVILGQDPYHDGNANGLAFGCKIDETPFMAQIKKAIAKYYDVLPKGFNQDLKDWAAQGVLLLNTKLTVTKGSPNSHSFLGWEHFTKDVVKKINTEDKPIAWFLWGRDAQKFQDLITNPKHLIICDKHPVAASYDKEDWNPKCFDAYDEFCSINDIKLINW